MIAMVLLAGLDLAGTMAAKEAVERRSVGLALTGAALFLAVFWVFISSLHVAELSTVTFGWIVILQVGVVLLDRFRYGVIPSPGTWLAIVILLAAQAYLILAPGTKPALELAAVSAESSDQRAESVQQGLAELDRPEYADGDAADQQRLADRFMSRVSHGPPNSDSAGDKPGPSLP